MPKISELAAASALTGAEMVPVVQSGTTVRTTASDLAPYKVKLTSDLAAYSTASLTDLTGLSFSVTSGTYYRFTFHVLYYVAADTTGIQLGLTRPAATVFSAIARVPNTVADDTDAFVDGFLNASGDSTVGARSPGTTKATANLATIEGTILPSADGTLQVRYAPEVAASLTVVQGTSGLLFKL